MTSDAENAKTFYRELFGWTYETGDEEKYGGYITAWKDGRIGGGHHAEGGGHGCHAGRLVHLPALRRRRRHRRGGQQHGGQVYMEPMDVPEQGSMAMFGDATGAVHRRLAAA